MIEPPQFRTVLRGADPEQVAEALKELQTSLVVSRRAAADRTIELSRLQEEHQALQATFDAAQQRLAELEQSAGSGQAASAPAGGGRSYGDLGARIGSMLSLAEEEATQIRAAAETEAAERRDHAVRALAAEMVAEEARLDETKARTAALGDELQQLRARADEEHGRMREHAMQEAEHIRQQARSDADNLLRQAEEQRAAAVTHRDQVHEHLGRIAELIGGVLGGRPEQPASSADTDRSEASASTARDAQATDLEPTVDDVVPAQKAQEKEADATVPDLTHPSPPAEKSGDSRDERNGHHGSEQPPTPVGAGRQADRPAFAPARSSDATQVIEPVSASAPQPRPSTARESRRQYADAGDSFVGEPWQEEDGAPSR